MLLRASSELQGDKVDVSAITDPKAADASGIPQAGVLVAFADAVVGRDDAELGRAREAVLDELGAPGLVDSAAVASNFERMVRIADGCGIPLDPPVVMLTEDVRDDLGLDQFASAANTPGQGFLGRSLGPVLRAVVPHLLRIAGSFRRT